MTKERSIEEKGIRFLIGFTGGSILTVILVEPCTRSGFGGALCIGVLYGLLFMEMRDGGSD